MNNVTLTGRLTKNPAITESANNTTARFTLAVDRRGEGSDFISCVAFGKTAEFVEKYFTKGKRIGVSKGRIHTGSYVNREGKTVYTTDVVADEVEFCDSKSKESNESTGFEIPDESELPFK